MSEYFPPELLERIREATDIVTLISEYVPLKRSGTNFKANCPFHMEKTPSFMVSPERQLFKCFGCGKAGNVFHFMMATTGLGFQEVVRKLAEKAGIVLEIEHEPNSGYAQRKDLLALMQWSASFYCKQLHHQAKEPMDYLKKRNLSPSSIEKFCLGYAPESWDTLTKAALREGFSTALLEQAGLSLKSQNQDSYYDRFRNRIIFPIWNAENEVIAFGGRVLRPEDNPKYLNSPETSLFSKSRVLYGMNFARPHVMSGKKILVMEGYTDVIAAHQFGFCESTATLGTSLTEEHARFIKRYADSVILVYDGDSAGVKGAERSLAHFLKQSVLLKIAVLPDNLDPCDFLVERGQEAFRSAIEKAEDFWDFQIRLVGQKHDLQNSSSRHYAITEIANKIKQIPDPLMQRLVINKVGEIFKIPEGLILESFGTNRQVHNPSVLKIESWKQHFQEEDEKFLLWASMHYPEKNEEIFQHYAAENFKNQDLAEMARCIEESWNQSNVINVTLLSLKLKPELAEKLVNVYYNPYGEIEEEAVTDRIKLIFKGLHRETYRQKMQKFKQLLATSMDDREIKSQILRDAHVYCKTNIQKKPVD